MGLKALRPDEGVWVHGWLYNRETGVLGDYDDDDDMKTLLFCVHSNHLHVKLLCNVEVVYRSH